MPYTLNDLKTLTSEELRSFFTELLEPLEPADYELTLSGLGFGKDDKTPEDASLLHYAASAGLIPIVDTLIQIGYANEKTKIGADIGHYAAFGGNLEALSYILDKGYAEKNARDTQGAGLIHYAARGGHLDIIRYLVGKGLDISATTAYGADALQYAVQGANIKDIQTLITLGLQSRLRAADDRGNTLLHAAAGAGRHRLVSLLINTYHLDPTIENLEKQTIVDFASRSDDAKTIEVCSQYFSEAAPPKDVEEEVKVAPSSPRRSST